jgi:CPA2 family monovalent cation:H+ antiporter-2
VVVEDVFLAVYLAFLQPALGGTAAGLDAVLAVTKAVAFLVVMMAVARWGTRLVSRLLSTGDDELLTVCFVGVAVLVAGVAAALGVSEAIGAFLAGQVLAGTAVAERIQRLVLPLRDLLAATFFFAFGLLVDPGQLVDVAGPVAVAVALTVVGNVAAGIVASRLHGFGPAEATNIGLTVLARGEFSLVLASLAVAAGLDGRLGPFTAAYVLVLAIGGPLVASRADSLSRLMPGKLLSKGSRS